jgi:hypothetical protein
MTLKTPSYILAEAIFVSLSFVILTYLIKTTIPTLATENNQIYLLFITAFLFHIIFEIIGLNLWYSLEYCKLQQ